MRNWFRYITTAITVLLLVPLTAVYEQNIQKFSEQHGLDSLLQKGANSMTQSTVGTVLLLAFVFLLGGTMALWLEFFLRRRFLSVFFGKSKEIVENKTFRHERVAIDNKSFRGCTFENVTLVYEGNGFFDIINCHFGIPMSLDVKYPIAQAGFQLARFAASTGVPLIERSPEVEKIRDRP